MYIQTHPSSGIPGSPFMETLRAGPLVCKLEISSLEVSYVWPPAALPHIGVQLCE